MEKFFNNPYALARETLAEIPGQVRKVVLLTLEVAIIHEVKGICS